MEVGTPQTIIGQHATRRSLHATPIQDSIFTPLTTPQEDAVAVAAIHDQDDVSSYVNSNNVSLRNLGPRSRVRGDFLVETARDDDICYSLDPNWKNASMICACVAGWKRRGSDLVLGGGCHSDGN